MANLNKVMRKCYNLLAKRERLLNQELRKVYLGHTQDITNIVAAAYQASLDNGVPNYSKMFNPVTQASKIQVEQEMRMVEGLFPDEDIFGGLDFDKLNRMELAHVQFTCAELRTAAITLDKLKKHLRDYLRYITDMLFYDYIEDVIGDIYVYSKYGKLDAIIPDKLYPYEQTLFREAINCANRQSEMLKNSLIRGQTLTGNNGAIKSISNYAVRKEMSNLEMLATSQGTRVTVELIGNSLPTKKNSTNNNVVTSTTKEAPYVTSFYSVVADEMACDFCKDVEAEQKAHPVPFELLKPWENAPPFHPRCRCGIEVIWSNDTDNEK